MTRLALNFQFQPLKAAFQGKFDYLLIITLISTLGLIPHVIFSEKVGKITYFKQAFDEDTYLLIRNSIGLYRLLSGSLTNLFLRIFDVGNDLALILPDVLYVVFAGLGALMFARRIADSTAVRALVSLLLLFSPDLMSLANITIWPPGILSTAREIMGPLGNKLVPNATENFLNIYRTPEPQLSYGFLFILWAILIDVVRRPDLLRSESRVAILLCTLALSFGYVFIFLPALACIAMVALICAYQRHATDFFLLLGSALSGLGLFLVVSLSSGLSGSLIFQSHLPILTPGVVASVVLSLVIAVAALRSTQVQGTMIFALGLVSLPVLICNQQLLTGWMVSTRDWERNITYPLIVAGVALACATMFTGTRRARLAAAALVCVVSAILVSAQVRSYFLWLPGNLKTVAMVRALDNVGESAVGALLVLDEPGLAPLLATRRSDSSFTIDYTDVFLQPVPLMGSRGTPPDSPHRAHLYEFFWRTGRTPAQVETILRAEANSGTGFYLGFLFALRDSWYPATDDRLVRRADILKAVPGIVDGYRRFVDEGGRPRLDRPVIRLTTLSELPSSKGISTQYVGRGSAGSVTVYAFRQSP